MLHVIFDRFLPFLSTLRRSVVSVLSLLLLLASGGIFYGAASPREPVALLREALTRDGLSGMLRAASAENVEMPSVPSMWHVDNIMPPAERPLSRAWRDLGKRIMVEADKAALTQQAATTVEQIESQTRLMLDVADWCSRSEGYGNVMLARRCLDIASVGVAKLLVNMEYPQEKCDQLVARLSSVALTREVGRRILNKEAGAEIFPPGISDEDQQRIWGEGKTLFRDQGRPERKGQRRSIEERPVVVRNLPFFEEPSWPANTVRTALSTWEIKWHERIVNGLDLQNVQRVEALAKFRKVVGGFPKEQKSKDELRPGPEGVFYAAWLRHAQRPAAMSEIESDQFRIVGLAAWYAYDQIARGVFVDEDTQAAALLGVISK